MMRIEPPGINPTMMELTNQIASEMTNISGVNEELLGSADDDKSGILSMLRQGAGLITLQGLFDNLDYSQKLVGELCMEIWQNNWTPGKVRRILGEEPSEQFYNKAFHKYNCVVEEGINTSTQKQMQAHQLLKLKEMGAPIEWSLVIEALPLQRKAELMESLKKQEEQGQKSQMEQMQAQMALLQAQIKEMDARAEAQQGLGIERASRVAENYALGVERRAAAEKDLAAKDLDHAKAIKEMEGMDIRQIQDAISVLSQVRDLLAPQQELSNNSFNVQNEVQGAMQRMGAPRQSPVPSGGPMAAPAPMRGMETT